MTLLILFNDSVPKNYKLFLFLYYSKKFLIFCFIIDLSVMLLISHYLSLVISFFSTYLHLYHEQQSLTSKCFMLFFLVACMVTCASTWKQCKSTQCKMRVLDMGSSKGILKAGEKN